MRQSRTGLVWSLALSALIGLSACRGPSKSADTAGGSGSSKPHYQIAVIPKGTTHSFWSTIHAGAVKAERELQAQGIDAHVVWKGPLREDDREQQIQVVEGFQSQGISAIVLAPLDARALVRPVEEATRAGIPVVIFDSALESKAAISYVATDNVKGGKLAGEHMGKLLNGKGKVLMLRYQEGSASTEAREQGFLEALKAGYPGVTVISSDQHAGPTRDTAKRVAENLLNRYPRPPGHLLRQRVVRRRDAAGAAGSRPRRQGRLPRLRRPSGLPRGDGQGRDVRLRPAEPVRDGLPRREDRGPASAGPEGAAGHRHGRARS